MRPAGLNPAARFRLVVLNSAVVLVVVWLSPGCGRSPHPPGEATVAPTQLERIDRSLSLAVAFLLSRQAQDGAWRSDVYGHFKDGDALTPLVLQTLLAAAPPSSTEPSCRRGAAYLVDMVRPDGSIDPGPQGLSYPVYTAAGAVLVLSHPSNERQRPARDAWRAFLRRRQLTEDLGWLPTDPEFGGWGFAEDVPRKPGPGDVRPPLLESNLSATVFALEALRGAGVPASDPAFARALTFLRRRQNHADDPAQREAAFDDGGFFFIYDDAARNKAGLAGKDSTARERYYSYGSTTADGLRALLACGLPSTAPRVVAARTWLESHFDAETHPGTYAAASEPLRAAVYYYYCWSAAQALRAVGSAQIRTSKGMVRWAGALAEALMHRQQADGSWLNPVRAVREDDPLVATSLAAAALAVCRDELRQDGSVNDGKGRR